MIARIMRRAGWAQDRDAVMGNENEQSRTPHLDRLFGQAKTVTRQVWQVAEQAREGIESAAGGMARDIGGKMLDRMFGDNAQKVPLSPEQVRVGQQRMREEDTAMQPKEELIKNRKRNAGKRHHWHRDQGGMER